MNRILESHHLRLIAQVARTESVTRAADRLNVTQSAVSHQLRELEDKLGTPIFVRSGRANAADARGAGPRRSRRRRAADDRAGRSAESSRWRVTRLANCASARTATPATPGCRRIVDGTAPRYPAFELHIVPEYTLDPIAALLDAKLDLAHHERGVRRPAAPLSRAVRRRARRRGAVVAPLGGSAVRDAGGDRGRAALPVFALAREQLHRAAGAAAGRARAGARHLSAAARGHHRDGEGGHGRHACCRSGRSPTASSRAASGRFASRRAASSASGTR